jgi:hypothetical protein
MAKSRQPHHRLSAPLFVFGCFITAWALWTLIYNLSAAPLELKHSHLGVPFLRRALHEHDQRGRSLTPSLHSQLAPVNRQTPAVSTMPDAHILSSENLADTALVTLIGGDISARSALALFQSLRDVGTRIPHIIAMLARGGHGSNACNSREWKISQNRSLVVCSGNDTIAEEIVSPNFLELYRKLGVEIRVVDHIPRTDFTRDIPGKLDSFWGYSLNRLVAFNWTEFRKIVYVDTDTLILHNIDSLVDEPHFSAATTYSCCNNHALPHISGGWVFEPSLKLGSYFWDLMVAGQPEQYPNRTLKSTRVTWHESDMALAMYAFSDWHYSDYIGHWPKVADARHGFVPGLKMLPRYASMNDSEFSVATRDYFTHAPLREGYMPELRQASAPGGRTGLGLPGVVWHALDLRYDQCIGNVCECSSIVGRDMPDKFRTVHFACLQVR